MTAEILTPHYWQDACHALSEADPIMREIITAYPGETLSRKNPPFISLCKSIVGQQISVKAAEAVWNRFADLCENVKPDTILNKTEEELRSVGLSRQKITYLKNLAEHFADGRIDPAHFHEMEDEAIIHSLTDVKGIGRWTAEMFLIFHLLRPDVFPLADIGLQKAVRKHYAMEVHELTTKWQPWRTVATWYLWRSLDPVPVAY